MQQVFYWIGHVRRLLCRSAVLSTNTQQLLPMNNPVPQPQTRVNCTNILDKNKFDTEPSSAEWAKSNLWGRLLV